MLSKLLLSASVAIALAAGAGSASAQKNQATQAPAASQTFIKEAIQGNLAEIEMGKLAQRKGLSEGVRDFGKMLEQDHSDAKQKAQQAAQAMNVTAPTAPSEKHKAAHDKLAALNGAQFDAQFIQAMISDHEEDIRKYEAEANRDDAAGRYAKATLPTLKKHLARAQSLGKGITTGQR